MKDWKYFEKLIKKSDGLSSNIALNYFKPINEANEIAKKFIKKKGKINKKQLDKPFVKDIIKKKFELPKKYDNTIRVLYENVFNHNKDLIKEFEAWEKNLLKEIKQVGKDAKADNLKEKLASIEASITLFKDILDN